MKFYYRQKNTHCHLLARLLQENDTMAINTVQQRSLHAETLKKVLGANILNLHAC